IFSRRERSAGDHIDGGLDSLSARPGGGDLRLTDLNGSLLVAHTGFEFRDLQGKLGHSPVHIDVISQRRRNAEGVSSISGRLPPRGLDLREPIENLVRALAPSQTAAVEGLRARLKPEGVLDATLLLSMRAGATHYLVELSDPHQVSFDAPGGR